MYSSCLFYTTNLVEKARKIHDLSPLATATFGRLLTITSIMAQEMKNSFDLDSMNDEIINKMNRAVNVETGRISANAIVRSNANYNQAIYLNANFDGSVDIDGKKAGRILAPSVVKTIKTGGLA